MEGVSAKHAALIQNRQELMLENFANDERKEQEQHLLN